MSLARIRALVVLGVLAVIAMGTVVWAIVHDSQGNSSARANCDRAKISVPEPAQVQVKILNSTDQDGLAGAVRDELAARGFVITDLGNSPAVIDGTAEVRFGPKAVGGAHLLRAHVPNATAVLDRRADDAVELVLGTGYTTLTPAEGVAKALSRLGKPVAPTPTCAH